MIRKPLLLVLAAASVGLFAAGCGGSSSSSTPSSTAAPATTTSGGATSTTGSSSPAGPAVAQAVALCKQAVNAAASLSANLKTKLLAVCDKAASGDEAGARKAAAQVCTEVIKATVPSSSQAQALASCPKP